jgi:YtkA-like
MRSNLSRIAAAVVVILVAGFLLLYIVASPPAGPDLSRSKPTEHALYNLAIEPELGPVRIGELHTWLVTLTARDGKAVEGAKIEVDGGMPEHGHGWPTDPAVTSYLGEGRYRVEGLKFNMGGWWQLRFAISAAEGDDSAVFNLKL